MLDLNTAEAISNRAAGRVERVAVFCNAPWNEVESVTRRIELERIQFHGDESRQEVELVDLPVIKAVRGADREAAQAYRELCCSSTTRWGVVEGGRSGTGARPRS